jgi:hypothetical protein
VAALLVQYHIRGLQLINKKYYYTQSDNYLVDLTHLVPTHINKITSLATEIWNSGFNRTRTYLKMNKSIGNEDQDGGKQR